MVFAVSASVGKLPNEAVVKRSELRNRLHLTLRFILEKAPSALSSLKNVLAAAFPYTADSCSAHIAYVSNLFRVITYAPALKSEILSLTMERMCKIDVQIQVDMEDFDEDEDTLLGEIFTSIKRHAMDYDDDDDYDSEEDEETESNTDTVDPEQKRKDNVKSAVTKLDAILDLLFDYYTKSFAKSSIIDKEALFNQMISIFTRSILPTYRSRHVQFLLFHFGQSVPALSERFADSLTKVIFDKNQPTMVKRSAAAYLASFIARSAQIESQTIISTFISLSRELDRLRALHEKNPNCCPDLNRFSTYYSIAQALLYIFCFRWRDLLLDEEDDEDFDADELRWEYGIKEALQRNLLQSTLNPLKVCAPGIVSQFAKVANHLKFMYIFTKIETNRRVRLSRTVSTPSGYGSIMERETALSNKTGESMFQLDAYFPFDPYLLPYSKRWIEGEYLEWKAVPGMEEDDEDEDSDSAAEEEDEEEDEEEYDEPTETESDAGS
jgi:RNA polymerase I-specific transcription initiation factor RRN3